jgi:alanine-synthesizing transaminase
MFSKRFADTLRPNALARRLAEQRAAGHTLIDLTESNPTRVGLRFPSKSLKAAWRVAASQPYAPDPRGLKEARRAIAGYYADTGRSVDPENLFLTAGTSEAYAMLFKLLADPGDEILIPRPGYPLLAYLTGFEGLNGILYPLTHSPEQGWAIDVEVLSALVTPRTRAIVVVNPNNPTGSYIKIDELRALDEMCRHHELALIVDEVFADYPTGSDPRRVPGVAGNTACLTFVLNGFSKLLALPQVKLAWIAICGAADLAREVGARLEMLLDFYLSVSTPVQHAAAALLAGRDAIQHKVRARLEINATTLIARAERTGNCRVLVREGGWYAVIDIRDALTDETRVLELLARADTLIHPGYFYEFGREGFVVLSLLPRPELFRTGIDRMLALCGGEGG